MKRELRNVIAALAPFNSMDTSMQISTILCLLEIAKAEEQGEEIGVGDVAKRVGLHSGTASRNIAYWAKGAPNITGAHDYVRIDFHSTDRRLRSLTLTPKGKAFVKQITGE